MSQRRVSEMIAGVLIPSPTTNYQVQRLLGSGAHGVVLQCKNMSNNETVALKIFKSKDNNDSGEDEETVLQNMEELHSERFNIIKLNESFTFRGRYCLVFEHLDMELLKFMRSSPGQHLQLKQIRPILQQLATSLEFLKSAGIIHTDLKPNNIMMVDHIRQPLKVKLIDFGLACDDPEDMIGEVIQSLWYRSPEVLYENPFTEAIDVWSLGCIAAEMFTGMPLFCTSNEAELKSQIEIAARDPLRGGQLRPHAFWARHFVEGRFIATHPFWNGEAMAEHCDMEWFLDLLSQMMMKTQHERITPSRILQHPFITMSHLQGSPSFYARSSKDMMNTCHNKSSDDGERGDPVNKDSSSTAAEKHSVSQTSTITRLEESQMTAEHASATGECSGGETVQINQPRKRCDTTSSDKPSTKKKKTEFQKELSESEAAPSNSQTFTIPGAEKEKKAAEHVSATRESTRDQIKYQSKRCDPTSSCKLLTKKRNMGLQQALSETEIAPSNPQTSPITRVEENKIDAKHGSTIEKGTGRQTVQIKHQRQRCEPISSGKLSTKNANMEFQKDLLESEAAPSNSQSSIITGVTKRKMTAEHDNRPDDSQADMSEQLAATGKGTSGQMGPPKRQRKNKQYDLMSTGKPSKKVRACPLQLSPRLK